MSVTFLRETVRRLRKHSVTRAGIKGVCTLTPRAIAEPTRENHWCHSPFTQPLAHKRMIEMAISTVVSGSSFPAIEEGGWVTPRNGPAAMPFVLTFDVEEHHRIEAAAGLQVEPALQSVYHERMIGVTEWILDQLADRQIHATFFIVGQIAETTPRLVRTIRQAGHEVASHGWDH